MHSFVIPASFKHVQTACVDTGGLLSWFIESCTSFPCLHSSLRVVEIDK